MALSVLSRPSPARLLSPVASPSITSAPRVGLAPHHGARVGHGVGDEGGGPADVARHRQVLLVQRRHDRGVGPWRAERRPGRASPSGVCSSCERQELRLGHAVALVLLVVLDHEVAGAHQAGHGRQGVEVGRAVLDRAVGGVERVGGGDGPHDLLLAGDEVAVEEGRLRRVDRVAPAVGGEVVARDGEDPGAGVGGVEVLDGGQLVARGATAGWVKLLAMVSPRKSEGLLATTSPATRSAVTRPTTWKRDHRAVSPLPSSMKSASRTTGVARSVERSARPAVVSVMNDLSAAADEGRVGERERARPRGSGPTKSSTRKKARSRQRTNAAATSDSTGTAKEVASSQMSWV